jgi:hypothetical protein
MLPLAVVLLLLIRYVAACQTVVSVPHDIPLVDVRGCSSSSSSGSSSSSNSSSYSLGYVIGQATKAMIQERLKGNSGQILDVGSSRQACAQH